MINPINYVKLDNGIVVQRYCILGRGNEIVYSVCEPFTWQTHSSSTSFETVGGTIERYGCYNSRNLPPELDALPSMTEERSTRVRAWHAKRNAEAYDYIKQAYPELLDLPARYCAGEIEIHNDDIYRMAYGPAYRYESVN